MTQEMTLHDEVLRHLDSIRPEDVTSYYTGRCGCACGCRGDYRYVEAHRAREGERRGYPVGDNEVVNLRSVRSLFTRLRNRMEEYEVSSYYPLDNGFAVDVEDRTYIISVL